MTEGMETISAEEAIDKIAGEGEKVSGKKVAEKAKKTTKRKTKAKTETAEPKKKAKATKAAEPEKAKSKKPATKRKRKKTYNVEKHPETGAMVLQELHYLRLMRAEQAVIIRERDLHIAKSNVKEFQMNANTQLQKLQEKVKETTQDLYNLKVAYMSTVNLVEKDTGLSLKEWTIDDDRLLRPIEEKSTQ